MEEKPQNRIQKVRADEIGRQIQISPIDLFSVWQQTQLLDSKTMLHGLRVNFENFGHTTKNTIFRLVKLLADLSTRL